MNCEKCGKEIPEGENKLCDDCKKALIQNIEEENSSDNVEKKEDNSTITSTEENIKKVEKENDEKFRKKGNKKWIITIVIILLLAVIACVLFIKNDVISTLTQKEGNSIANIRNYGYVAKQGAWIYYVAPSENGKKVSIYKSKMNGEKRETLVEEDWDILGLNIKGDYLYFIAISDEIVESNSDISSDESLDELDNKIYRMKTDGSDLEVINNNGFHNNCYEIYVIDDSIYYIGVDQNIYSMNLDGSGVKRLNEDETGFLGITEDYIIYNTERKAVEDKTENDDVTNDQTENTESDDSTSEENPTFETYIMKRDGTEKHSITGERLFSINLVNDYIYYVNDSKQIYKVKVDGTDNTLVSDSVQAYNLNVSDKYIYYMSYVDNTMEKIAIFRMNLDGSDNKVIYELENYSSFLNIVNNHVVFMDNNDEAGTINMIDSNGENRVKLYELTYEDYLNSGENDTIVQEGEEQNTNEEGEEAAINVDTVDEKTEE